MYGKSPVEFPRRIVCLTAEHVEICYALGAGDRVVGVPGTARRPAEAAAKLRIGGFTTFRVDRILDLRPDLILAFSDLQAEVCAELIRAGLPVFCTNQRSVDEVMQTILMVGGLLGAEAAARSLVLDMRDAISQVREFSRVWPDRPRVYFEEWDEPLIAGIRWVSELIELAGGRDAVAARPGWDRISAVRGGRIHEVEGADILSPGPSLLVGLQRVHELVQEALDARE
jgi:iron complex transport system substrate-binding protein